MHPARPASWHPLRLAAATLVALGVVSACSADSASADGSSSGDVAPGGGDAGASSSGSSGASSTSSSSSGSSGSSSGAPDAGPGAADPTKDGPWATTTAEASVAATQTTAALTLTVVLPSSGPSSGPFPVVFFAPEFQIPVKAYTAYATRLATHGLATVLVQAADGGFFDANVARDGKNLSAALAWAKAPGAALAGKLDATHAAAMGHSRGGKAATLAALADAGFKALLALDPVDTTPPAACNPVTECPDATAAIGQLEVPFLVLGETLDVTGATGQACAPAPDNYATFWSAAPSPALEVTVNGAGHASFVPDQTACGLGCTFCRTGTRPVDEVVTLSSAYAVAFFRKTLASEASWDSWLDGADAQVRWVTPGVVTLRKK
jgi:dienelactone hydrolase